MRNKIYGYFTTKTITRCFEVQIVRKPGIKHIHVFGVRNHSKIRDTFEKILTILTLNRIKISGYRYFINIVTDEPITISDNQFELSILLAMLKLLRGTDLKGNIYANGSIDLLGNITYSKAASLDMLCLASKIVYAPSSLLTRHSSRIGNLHLYSPARVTQIIHNQLIEPPPFRQSRIRCIKRNIIYLDSSNTAWHESLVKKDVVPLDEFISKQLVVGGGDLPLFKPDESSELQYLIQYAHFPEGIYMYKRSIDKLETIPCKLLRRGQVIIELEKSAPSTLRKLYRYKSELAKLLSTYEFDVILDGEFHTNEKQPMNQAASIDRLIANLNA